MNGMVIKVADGDTITVLTPEKKRVKSLFSISLAYREHLDDKSYIELEQYAQKNRLGLWNNPNPIKPSEWRKQ